MHGQGSAGPGGDADAEAERKSQALVNAEADGITEAVRNEDERNTEADNIDDD